MTAPQPDALPTEPFSAKAFNDSAQTAAVIDFTFTSGVFTVGSTGQVGINCLWDGRGYEGELAIFSLAGMAAFDPSSFEFIRETARRALSGSPLGYVVMSNVTAAAEWKESADRKTRLQTLPDQPTQTFSMPPGSQFGVLLVPQGTVQQVFERPKGKYHPLFSLMTANPKVVFYRGQMVDVTGEGHTFAIADQRLDRKAGRDYNDLIFQVRGAIGQALALETMITTPRDWRNSAIGKQLLRHVADLERGLPPVALPAADGFKSAPSGTVPVVGRMTPTVRGSQSAITPPVATALNTSALNTSAPTAARSILWSASPVSSPTLRTGIFWQNGASGSGDTVIWSTQGAAVQTQFYLVPCDNRIILAIADFDGDGQFDLLMRDNTGNISLLLMDGNQVRETVLIHATVPTGWQVETVGDFNGDGKADILWYHPQTGERMIVFLDGNRPTSSLPLLNLSADLVLQGIGDFNGDGKTDWIWRNRLTGLVQFFVNPTQTVSQAYAVPLEWQIKGLKDCTGDGKTDLIWHNQQTGDVAIWMMNGSTIVSTAILAANVPLSWQIAGLSDFTGDGKTDILWRNSATGQVAIWAVNGLAVSGTSVIGSVPSDWQVRLIEDFDRDGKPEILWHNRQTGQVGLWLMNGLTVTSAAMIGTTLSLTWEAIAPYRYTVRPTAITAKLASDPAVIDSLSPSTTDHPTIIGRVTGTAGGQVLNLRWVRTPTQSTAVTNFVDVTATSLDKYGYLQISAGQLRQLYGQATLPDGVYTLELQAIGGGTTTSTTVTFTLGVTLTAPELSLSNGVLVSINPTVVVAGQALPNTIVEVVKGPQVVGKARAAADGTWQTRVWNLSDGTQSLTARAIGTSGPIGAPSAPLTFTVDTRFTLAADSDSGRSFTDRVTNEDAVTLTGRVEPNARVEILVGPEVWAETTANATGQWTIDLEDLPDGASTLAARVTTVGGTAGATLRPLTVTVQRFAPPTPTNLALAASDSGINATDRLTNITTPLITGQALPGTLVQLWAGTLPLGETTVPPTGRWQLRATYLPAGRQAVTVIAYDDAGNWSEASTPLVITVDVTPPDLSIVSLVDNTDWAVGDLLTGTVQDAGSPINFITTRLDRVGSATNPLRQQTVPVAADGTFDALLDLTGVVANQAYTLMVMATDGAGNQTMRTLAFRLAPAATGVPVSGTVGTYRDRLALILATAIAYLTGNRKTILSQAQPSLLAVGEIIAAGNPPFGMAGLLWGLFELPNGATAMTIAGAQALGQTYAATVTNATAAILPQVMQAKVLAVAHGVVALRSALPTGSADTPLSLALKELANAYLATLPHPTQTTTQYGDQDNLLAQIWTATSRAELQVATTRLTPLVAGMTMPDQAVRFGARLLRVAQQTLTVQAQLANPGGLGVSAALLGLGFAYGRLNPTTVTDGALLAQWPLQRLWQATDEAGVQAARSAVGSLFNGFQSGPEQRTMLSYQAYQLDQLKTNGWLTPQVLADPGRIHDAVAMGMALTAPFVPVGVAPVTSAAGGAGSVTSAPTTGAFPDLLPVLSPFHRADGTPIYYPYPIEWKIEVPVFVTTLLTGYLPNSILPQSVISYGGVQILKIDSKAEGLVNELNPDSQVLTYGKFLQDGTYTTEQFNIRVLPSLNYVFWFKEYGYGRVRFVQFLRPELPIPPWVREFLGGGGAPGGVPDGFSRDPFYTPPPLPNFPVPLPQSPPSGVVIPAGVGKPLAPGDNRVLPSGGGTPLPSTELTPYDEASPNFPPPGNCTFPPLGRPISEMSEVEIVLEALRRVPCELQAEFRTEAETLLSNPQVVGASIVVLMVSTIIGGPLAALALTAVGAFGDLQNLANFFLALTEAKQKNLESELQRAAKFFAALLLSLVFSQIGRPDKLIDAFKLLKAGFLKLFGRGIAGTLEWVEIVGINKMAVYQKRFTPLFIKGIGESLEDAPRVKAALQNFPKAETVVAELGAKAVKLLSTLDEKLGHHPDLWAKRLSVMTPEEGKKLLEAVDRGVEIRKQLKDVNGKIVFDLKGYGKTLNLAYADFNFTFPGGGSIGNASEYRAFSGNQSFFADPGVLPAMNNLPQAERVLKIGGRGANPENHAEVKILENLIKKLKTQTRVTNVSYEGQLLPSFPDVRGTLTIFTERKPCSDSCAKILTEQLAIVFPNIQLGQGYTVLHGPRIVTVTTKELEQFLAKSQDFTNFPIY